tara:strand:- start:24719 stop:26011 length:1293 start_codon:yes stop_codon:yes gene_type:complete
MKPRNTLPINKVVYVAIYALIGIFVLIKGPVYFPDSFAFLSMDFNRSPFYCSFLKVMTSTFGNFYTIPVMLIQYGGLVYGSDYLIRTLHKIFKINVFGLTIIQFILLAPCVYLHFVSSTILSEGIAYPLCLIIVAQMIKMLVNSDLNFIYKIAPLLLLLILTRGQFMAFVPILCFVSLYIVFKQKMSLKKASVILLVLAILFLSSTAEKLYNKVVFGYAVNNAMNYVHLISASFYIADASDIDLFANQEERAYFSLVHNSLLEAKLTRTQVKSMANDEYDVFMKNFSKICNARVHEIGLHIFKQKGLDIYEQNIALNKMCSKMIFPLLAKNFNKWLVFYYKGLKTTFGSSKEMLLFIMLLVYGVVFTFKTSKPLYRFMVLITLLMFAHNALIALAAHAIRRYVFYFDWVVFAIVVLLLNEILKQKRLNES